jgi:hypothetical protein
MAKRSSFNLTQVIREFRQSHPTATAKDALAAVTKAHPGQKIKQGTFAVTFYKLGGGVRRKTVRRRKPGRVAAAAGGGNGSDAVFIAGLEFIRLAGGPEAARERLAGLKELIQTAKEVG